MGLVPLASMVAAGDRPPFKLHTKPEDIAPFFFVEHHPYALSVLLKIDDGFQADTFRKALRSTSGKKRKNGVNE